MGFSGALVKGGGGDGGQLCGRGVLPREERLLAMAASNVARGLGGARGRKSAGKGGQDAC